MDDNVCVMQCSRKRGKVYTIAVLMTQHLIRTPGYQGYYGCHKKRHADAMRKAVVDILDERGESKWITDNRIDRITLKDPMDPDDVERVLLLDWQTDDECV